MNAVAELNLPLNVVGIVAACENMPDGRAIKPGDIVTSAAGLDRRDPQHRRRRPPDPVRRAPLRAALQARRGGRHGHADRRHRRRARHAPHRRVRQRRRAGARTASTAAPRSTTAPGTCRSPRNTASSSRATSPTWPTSAGRDGGSITAAAFLAKFTKDLTWAHLDIAGTAYQGGARQGQHGPPERHAARVPAASRDAALTSCRRPASIST